MGLNGFGNPGKDGKDAGVVEAGTVGSGMGGAGPGIPGTDALLLWGGATQGGFWP
jgi:hypothetical protein